MTREEAKELLPIMQAFAEGKEIEFSDDGEIWLETNTPTWSSDKFYRIKSEPKYRPFKTQEECWEEMHKHPDFGWVKEKATKVTLNINGISDSSIMMFEDMSVFSEAFSIYEFLDGTPFGIKEE